MTVPLRAALYLRVSTARQVEHDVSIPDQRKQGEAYCASRGYASAALKVGEIDDDALDGEFGSFWPGADHGNDPRPLKHCQRARYVRLRSRRQPAQLRDALWPVPMDQRHEPAIFGCQRPQYLFWRMQRSHWTQGPPDAPPPAPSLPSLS